MLKSAFCSQAFKENECHARSQFSPRLHPSFPLKSAGVRGGKREQNLGPGANHAEKQLRGLFIYLFVCLFICLFEPGVVGAVIPRVAPCLQPSVRRRCGHLCVNHGAESADGAKRERSRPWGEEAAGGLCSQSSGGGCAEDAAVAPSAGLRPQRVALPSVYGRSGLSGGSERRRRRGSSRDVRAPRAGILGSYGLTAKSPAAVLLPVGAWSFTVLQAHEMLLVLGTPRVY